MKVALLPLGEEREASVFRQVAQFAKKHKINLDKALEDLSEAQLNLLLYGDGNANPSFDVDVDDETIPETYTGSYEGIIPMLKRWFSSSYSTEALRAWVEKYMELKKCETCNGARLKKESLWFKVDEKNISELSEMNLNKLMLWFEGIEKRLSNKQNAIAKDVLKEIRETITIFIRCGINLSFY